VCEELNGEDWLLINLRNTRSTVKKEEEKTEGLRRIVILSKWHPWHVARGPRCFCFSSNSAAWLHLLLVNPSVSCRFSYVLWCWWCIHWRFRRCAYGACVGLSGPCFERATGCCCAVGLLPYTCILGVLLRHALTLCRRIA